MAHNSLPLRTRGIELDTRCPMCYRVDEDGGHLFFKCKYSRAGWRELFMEDKQLLLAVCTSPKEVLQTIWRQSGENQVKIVTFLWCLWNARSGANAGEALKPITDVCFQTQPHASEFLEVMRKAHEVRVQDETPWCAPTEGFMKTNIDGAFSKGARKGGWGLIIRNSAGQVQGAGAGNIMTVNSSL